MSENLSKAEMDLAKAIRDIMINDASDAETQEEAFEAIKKGGANASDAIAAGLAMGVCVVNIVGRGRVTRDQLDKGMDALLADIRSAYAKNADLFLKLNELMDEAAEGGIQ